VRQQLELRDWVTVDQQQVGERAPLDEADV